jgi:hypothetical protein
VSVGRRNNGTKGGAMKACAAKYVELAESRGEEMARRWFEDVKKNGKTPSYHTLSADQMIPQAVSFYKKFSQMFTADKVAQKSLDFYLKYTEHSYKMGIPLDEALYAIVLMRRHIWLFAEFQNIFMTHIDQRQALDTLSRTILIFDYATYEIVKRYQELIAEEIDKKLGAGRK